MAENKRPMFESFVVKSFSERNMLKNLFKNKKKLTQQEAKAEENRLYEEKHKALVQEYKELYRTAIIMIKDFQDYGTHFSYTQTLQTELPGYYSKEYYEQYTDNDRLEEELKNIKLINNSFDTVVHKCHKKEHSYFFKSGKEYSYYHAYTNHKLYLNEHDWNILTGKTKK